MDLGAKWRVQEVGECAEILKEEFGADITRYGKLTDAEVASAGQKAQEMKNQAFLAKIYTKHLAKIFANKAEVERLTLEAIKMGLRTKEEIVSYLVKAGVAEAKHRASLDKMAHGLAKELQFVQQQTNLDKSFINLRFADRLRLLSAQHGSRQQMLSAATHKQLEFIGSAGARAAAHAERMAYLNGDRPTKSSSGSGGFWRGVTNFFSGRR